MLLVRIALIGLGLQGERLTDATSKTKGVILTCTVSRSEKRLAEFTKIRKIHGTSSISTLEDVDAVLVASANHLHASDAIAVAECKKPFLIEKPLARTLSEAKRIRTAAKKNRVKGFVDFQLRMHPSVLKAQRDIQKGKIGTLLYGEFVWAVGGLEGKTPSLPPHMRWREDPKESGGGSLPTRGSHLFDLIRFLTGKEVISVLAKSDATPTTVDRTALGVLTLSNGAAVYVMTSKSVPNSDNRVVLYGTKGVIEIRDIFTHVPAELYERTIQSFLKELAGKKTSLATLADGIASVAITEAFQKSAKTGKRVRISPWA
ncbi:MAG: Gfo/Idh/MocA family oxidoreductase [Patescibacteria group bacterium]